ncbi:hypothetical protein B296_00015209 [Ensete ventricosum]|uniref:STM1-like N-terminal domain-containing protein n=1 Tax=Ensete ventricosum TaxID=4639 RepID=A0A426ZWX8_ENSVE|nr:hypothetical protein B296_00015209 [Ensete ventricosum]
MASLNPFDLLAGDDNDDPSHLIAVQPQKVVAKKSPVSAEAPAAKFPSKPVPPTQADRCRIWHQAIGLCWLEVSN